jgi:hypothetical protein
LGLEAHDQHRETKVRPLRFQPLILLVVEMRGKVRPAQLVALEVERLQEIQGPVD